MAAITHTCNNRVNTQRDLTKSIQYSKHNIAQVHPPTNVTAKHQLATPNGFREVAGQGF